MISGGRFPRRGTTFGFRFIADFLLQEAAGSVGRISYPSCGFLLVEAECGRCGERVASGMLIWDGDLRPGMVIWGGCAKAGLGVHIADFIRPGAGSAVGWAGGSGSGQLVLKLECAEASIF